MSMRTVAPKNQFRVSFTLPGDRLNVVLDLLQGEISNVEMKQVSDPGEVFASRVPGLRKRLREVELANVNLKKGAIGLMLTAWTNGERRGPDDFLTLFQESGFSVTSISPTLSKLIGLGKIRKVEPNVYERVQE